MTTPKKETRNAHARRVGIPKWLRRYHACYGRGGVEAIVAMHLQVNVPTLDHWRDRTKAAAQGKPSESLSAGGTGSEPAAAALNYNETAAS